MTNTKAGSFGIPHSPYETRNSISASIQWRRLNQKKCSACILLVFALLAISTAGCRKPSGVVAVHGHVTYRGEALKSARITFYPATGGPITTGISQGEYEAEMPPGDYTVVVNVGAELPPGFKEGDPVPAPKVVLPPEYATRAQSTLKSTVKPGQSEPIDFELK